VLDPVLDPVLTRTRPSARPRAVALLLHGGAVHSDRAVGHGSAAWQRARVLQQAIAPALDEQGVAVWLLRYRLRGWNDRGTPSPLPDARWALTQVREELGVPVALDPAVRGVVGLAPWLPGDEPVLALHDRHLVVGHGRRDRITSFALSQEYVERSRAVARSASFHDLGPLGHYMLRDRAAWNAFAVASVLDVLRS
jgi:hypothetical protein